MKKFISMAMVAAMTTSMVPATAFAGDDVEATAKVVNKWTIKDSDGTEIENGGVKASAPEVVVEIKDVATQGTDPQTEFEYKVELDSATFDLDGDGELEQAEIDTIATGLSWDLAKDGTINATPETSTFAYALVDTGAADEYLEEIYEHLKEINAGVPTELPEALESIVYSTSDITSATTEQAKMTLDDFVTTFATPALTTPDATTTDVTGEAAVEAEVVEAYATAEYAALGLADYASHVAADKVIDGEQFEGYTITDSTTATNWVKKSTVLEWAADDATYKTYVDEDGYVEEVKTPNETFADWKATNATALTDFVDANLYEETVTANGDGTAGSGAGRVGISAEITGWKANSPEELTITIYCENDETLQEGDKFKLDLTSVLDKSADAYVSVTSDDLVISNDSENLLYVDVEDEGITASVKKLATVAEEEKAYLERDLVLESTVGNFAENQIIELKLSNGFEFTKEVDGNGDGSTYVLDRTDDDTVEVKVLDEGLDKIEIDAEHLQIEATSAKSGSVATIKVKAQNNVTGAFKASAAVEVMKVVDYTVVMSVDEDEDVPVIYSGVNVANEGLTDDSDHLSLEVTIEESFPGAWGMRKGFNIELPDGVYVTDVNVKDTEGLTTEKSTNDVSAAELEEIFGLAYQEGDHKAFEFEKRTFDDVDTELNEDEAMMKFELELVADPGFVGDVTLKLTGDLLDEQEVTVAKFATPYYVTAEQNDMKIDYRYTEVPTDVVIKEAEAGLWDADEAYFELTMEKHGDNFFEFEDADVTVDEESGMEIKDKVSSGTIRVTMEEESDETPATITVSNMEMFMSRSIPAGPYDLDAKTAMAVGYVQEVLFAPDDNNDVALTVGTPVSGKHDGDEPFEHDCDECTEEYYVGCVADFSSTVKEAFINVVTAGREQDDASFTTKVVVPVGESYIVSGESTVELDVPAYISAAGYTMLPVRAVANALGISNNNVIWNGESKTVTILYGQRIITMVAGQKVINVNGSAIPASAAVEIVDGRTFLPMRDLATALGVTDITWDAATKTATLNGGVVAE